MRQPQTTGMGPVAFQGQSHRGQVRRLARLARVALERYGLTGARVAPLLHGRNAVFRVEAPPGRRGTDGRAQRYVLRVHGPGTGEAAEIGSELL